jgi:selenocysteine lyase/cysteine desulfurase
MEISKLFSHVNKVIYFNHASSSPLAAPVRERMKKLVDELEAGDLSWDFWSGQLETFRSESARLLGTKSQEICSIPNTSTGLLIPLYSIPWQDTDNVVLVENGFPANVVPWERNLPHVQKRRVEIEGDAPLEDRIMETVDEHTRAVAIDWVDFFTGYRIDLKMIGDFCKERGIFLVVDGIQGAGAIELNLSNLHVDFFAAQSTKWMLGPVGAGILYVNEETMARLKPAFEGWMSLDWRDFNIFDPLPPIKEGAGRFEPGSQPGITLVGFVENLKILNSVGIEEIQRRIFELRGILLDGLARLDAEIISPADENHASGILTFRLPGKDSKALYDNLTNAKIVVSLRKNAIRLSPHFYNTAKEATRVLDVIRSFNNS